MRYKYVLFDLDGTLTDPYDGITNCVKHTLRTMGFELPDEDDLKKYIGPPLSYSFSVFNNMNEEQTKQAVSIYRAQYAITGMYENRLLDDTLSTLGMLREKGFKIAVATSKLESVAQEVLEYFKLTEYFDVIGGSLDDTRHLKSDVIAYVLDRFGISDKSQAVMVGDRFHDVEGAKACGIDCIGVLCGYGDRNELETAGAVYVAENLAEAAKYLIE